jgi:opacity protein-like surface antigen
MIGASNPQAGGPAQAMRFGRFTRRVAAPLLLTAGLLAGGQAVAAEAVAMSSSRFQITPFLGYAFGGDFEDPADGAERGLDEDVNFGVFFDIADDPWRHYEFLYSRQSTQVDGAAPIDMDVQYLHVGGIVSHPDAERVIPYFGLTIGAARFSPDGPDLKDATKLSFSVGGGARIPFTDHFGLRLDLRAFVSLLDEDGSLFCRSGSQGAGCRIVAESDTFVQYSASLGVTFAF